jgi:hypothetical protein
MTTDAKPAVAKAGVAQGHPVRHASGYHPARPPLRQMPGVIAVSIYMMILAGLDVFYVVDHRIGPIYLILSAFFVAGALGLLLLFRWAWALTLAAVALLSALFLRAYFTDHSYPALEQGLINLVIFLYLVRTELRDKLR